ncbi:hypothetical protein [Xenorhabdus sp. IM139775]|uniref:hypothetical protein n=1 Tax=Xenorhabdus sp. IM139775 TaxID=3025876 RepID=UPI00235988E7|nr:hypothetical protein [Xenorhabdus sp. IM139775]MDC9592905.1 hypothetical protein [Xenorhabdus sp. IM139775]
MKRISDDFVDGMVIFDGDDGKLKHFSQLEEYRKNQFSELERKLNENEEHHALITVEEALGFLKSVFCKNGEHKAWKDKVFSCTDPASSFAGNMLESIGVMKIIKEFKSLDVEAKEYKGRERDTYIKITGKKSVRKFITGTNYRIDNPKILKIGIDSKGIINGITNGVTHCIYFSLAYRSIEWIMKDEYALAEFLGNITVDVAKLVISGLATLVVGKIVTTPLLAIGASIVGISVGLFLFGLGVAAILYFLDNEYEITDKVVEKFKNEENKKKIKDNLIKGFSMGMFR